MTYYDFSTPSEWQWPGGWPRFQGGPLNGNEAGHCGKCGAPYFFDQGPHWSILPPEPRPSCACWNLPKTYTTTTTNGAIT